MEIFGISFSVSISIINDICSKNPCIFSNSSKALMSSFKFSNRPAASGVFSDCHICVYPDSSRIISATSVCFLELSKKSEFHLLKLLINLSNSKDNFVGSLSLSIANLAADINPIFFSLANSFNSCIDLSPKPRFGVFNILSNARPSSKLILALK